MKYASVCPYATYTNRQWKEKQGMANTPPAYHYVKINKE